MDIFCDGMVISLNDYRRLSVVGSGHQLQKARSTDKGQKEELLAFARSIRGDTDWPIPLWQQSQAMRISFEVERFLNPAVD